MTCPIANLEMSVFRKCREGQIRGVTCGSYLPETARSWQLDFFGWLYLNHLCLWRIEMVKRCVVGNCSNLIVTDYLMHMFPQDPISRQKCEKFFRNGRSDKTHATANSTICGTHFMTPDDFEGYMQWMMDYKKQLDLKKSTISSKNRNKAPRCTATTPSTAMLLSTLSSTASHLHCNAVLRQAD